MAPTGCFIFTCKIPFLLGFLKERLGNPPAFPVVSDSPSPASVSLAANERGTFKLLLLLLFWVFFLFLPTKAGQEEAAHRGALAEEVGAALTPVPPWVLGCCGAPLAAS